MTMQSEIICILMQRDGLSREVAHTMLEGARQAVLEGVAPDEVLDEWFGLEPDYIFELL